MSGSILSTRGRPFGMKLWRGRVSLSSERIEVRGWRLARRHSSAILLSDIRQVEWWSSFPGTPNVKLVLQDGDERLFWLESPGVWRFELARLLGENVMKSTLPPPQVVRTAA